MKKCANDGSVNIPEGDKVIDLSHEILAQEDYQKLADIIKNTGVVEEICLPVIAKEDAVNIINILNQATICNSTLTRMNINIEGNNTGLSADAVMQLQQIQSRLQRNKNRIFGIHGGGCIGLGLMADIVSKSPYKYHILATSNNKFTRNVVNNANKLWLQHSENEMTCVDDVRMISREQQDILRLYSESCLVAISVTPAVFPCIASDIARALIHRYETDGSGLSILILMNIPNGEKFVRDGVEKEILKITGDKVYTDKILGNIKFLPTVVDRIVMPIQEHQLKQHLRRREFSIFNAEKKFTMYVPETFVEARRFPLMTTTSDLSMIESVKNHYINGPHAILAWMGALMGYTKVADAIKNPAISHYIKKLMDEEIAPILCAKYPALSRSHLKLLKDTFLERCRKNTDDSVVRVGRDPMRKLNQGDRIRGTIEFARKHHLPVTTHRLEKGLAAGVLYATLFDPENPGCKKIREIYENNNDSFYSVLCYHGPSPAGIFTGLEPHDDAVLINGILSNIAELQTMHTTIAAEDEANVSLSGWRGTRLLSGKNMGYH